LFLKEYASCWFCGGCGSGVLKSAEVVDSVGVVGGCGSKFLGSEDVGILEERLRAEGD
jgi:hypothetical protein